MKKRDCRKLSESELANLRNEVVAAHRKTGANCAKAAKELGVSRYFVIKWIRKYREEYNHAIKEGRSVRDIKVEAKKRGRRAKSSDISIPFEFSWDAKRTIENNTPNQVGIKSLLWTERAVKKLFKLKYNINISHEAVYKFIIDLVFSQYRTEYRKIEDDLITSGSYASAIVNGYVYFLKKPKYLKRDEWGLEVYELFLKQRKKGGLSQLKSNKCNKCYIFSYPHT